MMLQPLRLSLLFRGLSRKPQEHISDTKFVAPVMMEPLNPEVPRHETESAESAREVQIRNCYVTRRDLEEHGYTPGCPVCFDLGAGRARRPGQNHSAGCRERLMEAIRNLGR